MITLTNEDMMEEMDSNTPGYSAPESNCECTGDETCDICSKDDFGLSETERQKIVKKAVKASKEAHTYWDEIYDLMEQDWGMYSGLGQWTEEAKAARANRPRLTLNHLPKFVRHGVAETKKNPPGITLSPRESGDKMKADMGMGIIRYIEDSCGAKYIYANAMEHAYIGGLGWIRGTFDDKKILLKKVKDCFSFMVDPDSEETDGSDAKYFIAHSKKKDGKKQIDCYEFWWKDEDEVKWAIIEGNNICDYGIFPGEIIPIFPVYGDDMQYRDTRILKGVIRDLTDAQRSYNYVKSQEIETVALTPKSPIIAREGTLQGYEQDWKRASKTPVDILYTTGKDLEGNPAPDPVFANTNPSIAWAPQITQGAVADLREISGVYDTSLGATSQEASGKAIIAKQQTSDASQYTYSEHLQATIQRIGKWMVGMIQPIMGEMDVVRVLGEDGKQSIVQLNQPMKDPQTGEQIFVDLDFGDMDISISSGEAYATRREAGSQAIQDIMQAIPASAQFIADIAVRNLDLPGAEEAADRLKRMLPPELQDKQETQGVPQVIVDQMMQQSQTAMQQSQQIIEGLKRQVYALQVEVQNGTQAAMATEQIKSQTQMAVAQIKESGANERKMADIRQKTESDNKDIAIEVAKLQKPVDPKPQPVPNSVTTNTTNITPVTPIPTPEPLVFRNTLGNNEWTGVR